MKLKLLAPTDGGAKRFKFNDFSQFQEIVKAVFKDLRDVADLNAKYQPLYYSSREASHEVARFKRRDERASVSLLSREEGLLPLGQESEFSALDATGTSKLPCLKLMSSGQCSYGSKCTFEHNYENNSSQCLALIRNLRKYYNSGKQSHEWVHVSVGNVPGSSGASDFKRTNRTFDKSVSMVQCDGNDVAFGIDELGAFTECVNEDVLAEDTE